ncbi:MAG: RodZ domain-containing protein [Terriglobales bacterium]
MPSFGEKLKLEREKRKISLEQISSSTKIGTRMLQALEEEKFNQLPGGIFNKGFVRAYARAVGLDEDQAVADYLQASGEASPARPELTRNGAPSDGPPRDPIRIRETARDKMTRDSAARDEEHRISRLEAISDDYSRPLPWGAFAVILLVIALLLSLWSHRRREQERKDAHPATPKAAVPSDASLRKMGLLPSASSGSANSMSATPGAGGSAAAPASGPAVVGASGAPGTATSTAEKAPATPIRNSPTSNGALAGHELQTAVTTPGPGEFLVLVRAREESWVSVTVDGKLSGSELLEPGNERTFLAHDRVFVKTGNAGALDFQLDGKTLPVGGGYGEVKAVTIGHAGVIPTAAEPPANP